MTGNKSVTAPAGKTLNRVKTRCSLAILLAPSIFLLVLVMVFPLSYNIFLSFFKFDLHKAWQGLFYRGLKNYLSVFSDPEVLFSFRITLTFAFFSIMIEFVLGLILALLLNRQLVAEWLLRTIILIPLFTSPVVVGLMWKIMLNPDFGIISYYLQLIGIGPISFLGSSTLALPAIIAVDVWQTTPFIYIMLLAGLKSLSNSPIESAKIDGASWFRILVSIQLPLLKPVIVVVLLFKALGAIQVFGTVYVLTAGGPGTSTRVISILIFQKSFQLFHIGYGATLSVIYALLTFAIIALIVTFIKERA